MQWGLLRSFLASCRHASFATHAAKQKNNASINLTPYVSPLLFRLHPDTIQRHSKEFAQQNEHAMKQLNQFLELATYGCNNDAYQARKLMLTLAQDRNDPSAPLRFPMAFHVVRDNSFDAVTYTIEVPGNLMRRTLASASRAASADRKFDPTSAIHSPFAREWQRATKRILKELFLLSHLSVDAMDESPTQLALWLAQEESAEVQSALNIAAHNQKVYQDAQLFDRQFMQLLQQEKNIVHEFTTGLEDGPTTQHAVLTSLLAKRVFLAKDFDEVKDKQQVLYWLANILLIHFMELRLHSLVWNKMMLMVIRPKDEEEEVVPEVLWDEEKPEDGMAFVIPYGMNATELIDFLYEHVEELEFALANAHETMKRHQKPKQKKSNKKKLTTKPRRLSWYELDMMK